VITIPDERGERIPLTLGDWDPEAGTATHSMRSPVPWVGPVTSAITAPWSASAGVSAWPLSTP
jgi:hypothetical protein